MTYTFKVTRYTVKVRRYIFELTTYIFEVTTSMFFKRLERLGKLQDSRENKTNWFPE